MSGIVLELWDDAVEPCNGILELCGGDEEQIGWDRGTVGS